MSSPCEIGPIRRAANPAAGKLVCLRVVLDDSGVPLAQMFPTATDALAEWRAMVRLWHAGLDDEGWQTLLETLLLFPYDDGWLLSDESTLIFTGDYRTAEAQLLGDPELEGMLRTGKVFTDSAMSSRPEDQRLLERLARWVFQPSGTAAVPTMLPGDIGDLKKMLRSIEAGARLRGKGLFALIAALSRESWRLPLDVVRRALKHLATDPGDVPRGFVGTLFELVGTACSHPAVLEDEELFVRLQRWVDAKPAEDLGALVLVWLTITRSNRRHRGLDRLFHRLLASARRTVDEDGWAWTHVPDEVFEYFASADADDWDFDSALLQEFVDGVQYSRRSIDPGHLLAVVERFLRTQPDEALLAELVRAGLPDPAPGEATLDLPAAVEALRRLAGETGSTRP